MNRRQYRAAWSRARYAALKAAHRCTRCRKTTRRPSTCWACDQKRKKERRQLRRLGYCRCGNEARSGWKQCGDCQAADRERRKAS